MFIKMFLVKSAPFRFKILLDDFLKVEYCIVQKKHSLTQPDMFFHKPEDFFTVHLMDLV